MRECHRAFLYALVGGLVVHVLTLRRCAEPWTVPETSDDTTVLAVKNDGELVLTPKLNQFKGDIDTKRGALKDELDGKREELETKVDEIDGRLETLTTTVDGVKSKTDHLSFSDYGHFQTMRINLYGKKLHLKYENTPKGWHFYSEGRPQSWV